MAKPKWEKLRGKYEPRPLTDEGGFREKVDRAKKIHVEESLENLLKLFATFDERKEQHEEGIKEMNVQLEAVDQLIREKYERQGIRSQEDTSGNVFTSSIEPYVSIKDKVKFLAFMDQHPELDYLWAIQPKSLAAYIKDLLDQGLDAKVPDSISVFRKESIKLTRRKT